uniref:Tn3 family transposase n=1 Tax=Haemonchus contortus TaxID=6289 RepID=A0A7I5EAZ1_HAECO
FERQSARARVALLVEEENQTISWCIQSTRKRSGNSMERVARETRRQPTIFDQIEQHDRIVRRQLRFLYASLLSMERRMQELEHLIVWGRWPINNQPPPPPPQ